METITIFIDRQVTAWIRDVYEVETPSLNSLEGTLINNQANLIDILSIESDTLLGKSKFTPLDSSVLDKEIPVLNFNKEPVYVVTLERSNQPLIDNTDNAV